MKESTPDDIAVLCSHVNVDRNRYRVFSRESVRPERPSQRTAETPVAIELAEPQIPSSRLSQVIQPDKVRQPEKVKQPGLRGDESIVRPAGPRHGERRMLHSILRDSAEETGVEGERQNQKHLSEQAVSLFAASGGAGATTVTATLARLFSRRRESTVIVDGRPESVLPFYFGSRNGAHLGRSFAALQDASDAPVHILTRDIWDAGQKPTDTLNHDWLKRGLSRLESEVHHGLVDVWPNLPVAVFDEFCASGICLVVAVPDLNSVLGVRRIAKYLEERELVSSPLYVLNKFDERQALHVEMLDWFERQFPQNPVITLRKTDETSEALAEGLTVMDYAPESGIVDDYSELAEMIHDVLDGRSTSGVAIANPLRNK